MQKLVVFPIGAQAFNIPFPFGLGYIAYSPDGIILSKVRRDGPNTGLYKIEFEPTRASLVPGSAGLTSVNGIGASRAKIVVSAGYLRVTECGMFELTLESGRVRKVLDNSDCKYLSAWQSSSLSPDGGRVVAVRRHRVELVDLGAGTVRSLGGGFLEAAWSPNGLWIAALENGGRDGTILFDALSFTRRRELPNSDVVWSPDSRYLLAGRQGFGCDPYWGTLAMMDIESGKLSTIQSSVCKVHDVRIGWVSVTGR
jgi:hypothetical protein